MKKRALFSVYKKEGALELAAFLQKSNWEIVSTGGTAKYLRDGGIAVTDVSEITGFPECLDGRVKTLHPAVHAGLLALRDNEAHVQTLRTLGITEISLVCVNLYPFFEKVKEDLPLPQTLEFIDIGGPSMLRSAAKNYKSVLVLTNAEDYPAVIAEVESGIPNPALRKALAAKVFALTSAYDAAVARYLLAENTPAAKTEEPEGAAFPNYFPMPLEKSLALRYGENGHQKAALYRYADSDGIFSAMEVLNGKELSYNNIRDLDLAWKAVCSFGLPAAGVPPLGENELPLSAAARTTAAAPNCCAVTCVAVKHNTPCGIGQGGTPYEAFIKAKASDTVSIFGGIAAFNAVCDTKTALALDKLFLEIVAAPDFEPDALAVLRQKKNLRVVKIARAPADRLECVSIDGGLLVQETNRRLFDKWEVVTKAQVPPELIPELVFGMRAVCWIKSNAVAVVKDGMLLGAGGGETSRIWAAELALKRSAERAAALTGAASSGLDGAEYAALPPLTRDGKAAAVLASDAFFPFSDVVELAAANGIRAIIQCGGSANDSLSIEACDKHGIAMVFTGIRCFKH
ncbi:MAG: bifunctional phosphoribosylaminoimidazolecarboxamide formyltransferase/IMP cyclohydrolase [Spirochaetaceae bacterium]|jgi:phosphoribosylaminoimidazolecarboxamide formyltransferase/IMP cyclohydrolase|nr:bifunctional phosphoribosylaminoimidazolecarboxamide formyltransferase/IMP cyclohydrolase [Spirochaetaceae bacterium]